MQHEGGERALPAQRWSELTEELGPYAKSKSRRVIIKYKISVNVEGTGDVTLCLQMSLNICQAVTGRRKQTYSEIPKESAQEASVR